MAKVSVSKMPIPVVRIVPRDHSEGDPNHYQADAEFPDGSHCHAIAPTPAEALRDLALFWLDKGDANGVLTKIDVAR